ncbi:hypothetical protein QE152_g37722 [Popillia japonica]|uniref:Uncharacterized protein n=1 Tax=Popillia japonica TaxID=7064 RepID=A0AAW1I903_POPJA
MALDVNVTIGEGIAPNVKGVEVNDNRGVEGGGEGCLHVGLEISDPTLISRTGDNRFTEALVGTAFEGGECRATTDKGIFIQYKVNVVFIRSQIVCYSVYMEKNETCDETNRM